MIVKLDPSYDVLLSYRRTEASVEARTLKIRLDELNVSSWFDVLNLPQDRAMKKDDLKSALEYAVRSSRLVVQFQYFQPIEAFSWAFFERQFAKELLTVMMRSPEASLLYSFSGDAILFYDITHLAYLLALTVGKTNGIDTYWRRHLWPIESMLADRAYLYHFAAFHTWESLPDVLDPDKPWSRRNVLPGDEKPGFHSETVRGHELHTRDRKHCFRCGRRFGYLGCILIWLGRGRAVCYQCHENLAYDKKRLDRLLALALMLILIAGIWGLSLVAFPKLSSVWHAVMAAMIGLGAAFFLWGLYLRRWRKLVNGGSKFKSSSQVFNKPERR